MPEQPPLTVSFTYQYEDFFQPPNAQRSIFNAFSGWTVVIVGVLAIGLLIAITETGRVSINSQALLIFIPIAMLFIFAVHFSNRRSARLHRQQWESHTTHRTWTVTFSSEGITWQSPLSLTRESWALYCDHQWTPYGVYLHTSTTQHILIPARAIPRDVLPQLRELLRAHCSQSQGFPVLPPGPTA